MMVSGVLIARIYMERDTIGRALAFMHPWRTPIVARHCRRRDRALRL